MGLEPTTSWLEVRCAIQLRQAGKLVSCHYYKNIDYLLQSLRTGIEPVTFRLTVERSTNWANGENLTHPKTVEGFEPPRAKPSRFQVCLLNHSDIPSKVPVNLSQKYLYCKMRCRFYYSSLFFIPSVYLFYLCFYNITFWPTLPYIPLISIKYETL